jgi:UDP-N-acetylmuramoyl-L-alanyl-D-glutamate--2,6-diaminopimelate ligase
LKLKDLIEGLNPVIMTGSTETEISDIAYDSRKVKKGSLFVCIEGMETDGHKYIDDAIDSGAAAVLIQKDADIPDNISVVKIPDTRYGLAYVSSRFFGNPSSKVNLIGATGTKGKTTTTFMIKFILEAAGRKTGLIGSVAKYIGSDEYYMPRTTPESYELQLLFNEMVSSNVTDVIIEAASQGLKYKRTDFCDFDIGIFTNLYNDHIAPGEHTDIDDYFQSKKLLFSMCKTGFVNADSTYSAEIIRDAKCSIFTYGIDNKADITAENIITNAGDSEFYVKCPWINDKIQINMPGLFNVYNALAAIGVCGFMDIDSDSIKQGLLNCKVKGRAEKVETGRDFTVIIDHAHNQDSLENILKALKQTSKGRVISLFGCGGNRAKDRRYGMGEVSGNYADFTIITSDNPRSEDPESITKDIETGMIKTNGKYIIIVDRTSAIKYALENACKDDVILLAGKGDETYQEFKDKTIHFDEREVVRGLLEELA